MVAIINTWNIKMLINIFKKKQQIINLNTNDKITLICFLNSIDIIFSCKHVQTNTKLNDIGFTLAFESVSSFFFVF